MTNQTQHTPGPLRVESYRDMYKVMYDSPAENSDKTLPLEVALVSLEADAKLFASAPTLKAERDALERELADLKQSHDEVLRNLNQVSGQFQTADGKLRKLAGPFNFALKFFDACSGTEEEQGFLEILQDLKYRAEGLTALINNGKMWAGETRALLKEIGVNLVENR